MKNKIAQRLKKLRSDEGISQAKMAVRIGIPQQTYDTWEQGKAHPDADRLIQLSAIHDVTVDYLIGTSDDMYAGGRKRKDDPHMETVITGENKGNIITGNKISGNGNRVTYGNKHP